MARDGQARSWIAWKKRRRTLDVPATGDDANALLTEQNDGLVTEDGYAIVLEEGGG